MANDENNEYHRRFDRYRIRDGSEWEWNFDGGLVIPPPGELGRDITRDPDRDRDLDRKREQARKHDRDRKRDRNRKRRRDRKRDRDAERSLGRAQDQKASQRFPVLSRHNIIDLRPRQQVRRLGNKTRITVEHGLNQKHKVDDKDYHGLVQDYGDTAKRGRPTTRRILAPGMLRTPSTSRSRSRSRSSIRNSNSHTAPSVVRRINKA